MSDKPQILKIEKTFPLERGGELPALEIAYHTWGELNEAKDNVVWVFHALTANSNLADWWGDILTDESALSPQKYFIVCANILGSPYGTSSPLTINPETGAPYYSDFPMYTIRDMIAAHQLLRDHLGIKKVAIGLGGSMGGFQAYEWAVQEPEFFEKLILVVTGPKESPWRLAVHSAQRIAIEADPTWRDHDMRAGEHGVAAARAIGMLSYRNHTIFNQTQADEISKMDGFRADSYMRYQGKKLIDRKFQGYLLWSMTKGMDSHDIGRDRGGVEAALQLIQAEVLQISIDSDILFACDEQEWIASHIPKVTYREIKSLYGHDGFLTEFGKINVLMKEFLG
ncbi:homoserine O-acetyltransferase [Reichenbachiella agariperforans]|uniref:Homoserine O-acetyltransferase n=1 Tax=Reichenbachiella agariperforans TaxID=156994 RepID=A0A1M6QGV6_REIAG|nr:homoserine O-acetyltransferase [Reichenbachiella agariperforans]SHK19456.1 homoserine O-acetyltransferase [Reichenbachiella agariperforans]